MRLYISGPMTGIEDFNYPAFHLAKSDLEAGGHVCLSPADLPIREDWEWIDYILADLDSVFAAEGIATLEGHEQSKGARIECRIAALRDIPVKSLAEWLV